MAQTRENSRFLILFTTLVAAILLVSCSGKANLYTPDYESLSEYKIPEWFKDIKLGVFIHWGVYSVPGFGSEWYPRNMYIEGSRIFKYHRETWGDQGSFGYKDFIPEFRAEKWNPAEWASLFKQSGIRYVVPVAEHHDGFPMYDCSFTEWNAKRMGPKRDIIGELLQACRAEGLYTGVSSHRAFNWEYYRKDPAFDTWKPEFAGLYGKRSNQRWPSEAFCQDWLDRTLELATKYKPDIFWFDFYLTQPEFREQRKEFAARYYNLSLQWEKEVVLQYKYDTWPENVGLLDIERGKLGDIRRPFWQTDTSLDYRSWGYINNPEYKSVNYLIDDFIDIVSKNGSMLLNIGPRPDGTIPEEQQQMLREIGSWLKINGEAIYGTRHWVRYGEGPTGTAAGAHAERQNRAGTAEDFRFTVKGKHLFAICLDWPVADSFVIKSLARTSTDREKLSLKSVEILGPDTTTQKADWKQTNEALIVEKPETPPCDHAYVIKITVAGLEEQMTRYLQSQPEPAITISLTPSECNRTTEGFRIRDERIDQWNDPVAISWDFKVKRGGSYEVILTQATTPAGRDGAEATGNPEKYIVTINDWAAEGVVESTGGRRQWTTVSLGIVRLEPGGPYTCTIQPVNGDNWSGRMNLRNIKLKYRGTSEE